MASCPHTTLELLPERKKTLRCRHCDLTLDAEELGDGYCPECFEISGKKRYEFEETNPPDGRVAKYRCEECGAIIKTADSVGS
jgi:phage FluMu protein Com